MVTPCTGQFEGYWWLVYTKPRNEKALAGDLERLRIRHFLPLARVKRRYSGRTRYLQVPLFAGYMFLRGGVEERYATMDTRRVVNVIEVKDQVRLKHDLRQVGLATTSTEPLDLYPGIRKGRRCRVVAGGLKGLEGIVQRRRDACRVYVAVDVLGQSAELEIDPSLLEIIE